MDDSEVVSLWRQLSTLQKTYIHFLMLLYRRFPRVVTVSLVAALVVYLLLEPDRAALPVAVLAGYYGAFMAVIMP